MIPHYRQHQDYERDHDEDDEKIYVASTTFFDGEDTEVRVTVVVPFSGEDFYGEGFAFLSENDAYDSEIGQQIAYIRALRDALNDAEIHVVSKVKTIEEAIQEERSAAYPAYEGQYEAELDKPGHVPGEYACPQVNFCPSCIEDGEDLTKPCPYSGNRIYYGVDAPKELYR